MRFSPEIEAFLETLTPLTIDDLIAIARRQLMQKDPDVLFVDQRGNVWAPGVGGLTMAQTSDDNDPLPFPLRRYAYTGDVDQSGFDPALID